MKTLRTLFCASAVALAALASSETFRVTQDLTNLPTNTYFADFSLTGGNVDPNSTSSVTITNLTFTGILAYYQDIVGDYTPVTSGFRLADGPTYGFADTYFILSKKAGEASISFDVETTSTSSFATDEDYFLYRLLDSSRNGTIATSGPFGDGFLGIKLDALNTQVETYQNLSGYRIPTVTVSPITVAPVPEPTTLALGLGTGIVGLLRKKRRR